MKTNLFRCLSLGMLLSVMVITVPAARAQYWVSFDEHTRYLALGDSLTAGYTAHPATQGFVYQLYQSGVIDNVNNTLFCNMGVPGATSEDVLQHQIPQAERFFKNTGKSYRQIVTLTVGGNDMLQVLGGADPVVVLSKFGGNLAAILGYLVTHFPSSHVYVANQYDPMLPVEGDALLVASLNSVITSVVQNFEPQVELVDIYSAFQGREGLLLGERTGAEPLQIHPTNAGYEVMAKAFVDAIR